MVFETGLISVQQWRQGTITLSWLYYFFKTFPCAPALKQNWKFDRCVVVQWKRLLILSFWEDIQIWPIYKPLKITIYIYIQLLRTPLNFPDTVSVYAEHDPEHQILVTLTGPWNMQGRKETGSTCIKVIMYTNLELLAMILGNPVYQWMMSTAKNKAQGDLQCTSCFEDLKRNCCIKGWGHIRQFIPGTRWYQQTKPCTTSQVLIAANLAGKYGQWEGRSYAQSGI